MREILFRGKVKHYGNHYYAQEWINGSFVKGALGVSIFTEEEDCYGNITRQSNVEVIPETIGQYTGLKDKNGKMIFEGDLFTIGAEKETFEVVYESGCFLAYWNGEQCGLLGELMICFVEIIGNIHDNPELITNPK